MAKSSVVKGESFQVDGLKELQRKLKRLGDSELPKALRDVNKSSAEVVAKEARSLAPVRTGKLRDSIKAMASQRDARVKGGGARVPYFKFIDFGGTTGRGHGSGGGGAIKRPFLKDGRILYKAVRNRRPDVMDAYEKAIREFCKRSGMT